MKNPMSTTEMKQAIDDNAAGYDMQYKSLHNREAEWLDRIGGRVGQSLDFYTNEYRRKPEPQEWFINEYEHVAGAHKTLESATKNECNSPIRRIRVVEDPDWTEPEPEETNPWRPIVKGEWPECKPGSKIIMRWRDGTTISREAGLITWHNTAAIEWKFAEDK